MTTIRQLASEDQPALERFLHRHPAETMFLRANLSRSGIIEGDQPYQGRYVAAFEQDRITGVAACYWNGMLVVLAPDQVAALAAAAVAGRRIAGILGPWQQALDAQEALGLDKARHKLRSREILMSLALADLKLPAPLLNNQALQCRLATADDQEMLHQWRLDFSCESLGASPSQALAQSSAADVARWIAEKSQFILLDNGRPVSGCSFNARLPDAVQIGNVWTPPEWRSRGYARAVVAGALDLARQDGVKIAVLFTPEDNTAARTAYLALGFTAIGDYAMLLFAD